MKEIHSIGGGRFFSGGGGGDRRLRPHHHQNHQALKCPRCDSLNTKFCYYNNYNLSQPRHFCKNCRRYWTKGGILRNVPVGGGCRKSKHSNKAIKNSTSSENAAAAASKLADPELKSNSHSSSESSSLTAATAAAAAATTEAMSAPTSNCASNKKINLGNTHNSKLLLNHHQSLNPGFEFEQGVGGGDSGVFSEIGSLTSLITSTNEALAFGFGNSIPDATSFGFNAQQGSDQLSAVPDGGHDQCHWLQQKVISIGSDHHQQDFTAGSLLDQTVPVELNKTGHGGFGPLDWHASGDQGLFDLPDTVDQAYWTTNTHWSDQDNPTLFHLP